MHASHSPDARPSLLRGAEHTALPEFRKAYDEDGMSVDEFENFGAVRRTMRQFLEAGAALDSLVCDVILPVI